jgi:hypothetical protein
MGKIKVIAEIVPKGDFPVVSAPNVAAGDTTLTAALNAKANTSDVNTALGNKVDKVNGKGLSTNDYTTAEKNKLAAIEAQANKTTISTSVPATPTHSTVPSMKLVNDTYAPNSDLVAGLATKADSSTVSSLSSQVSTNTSNIAIQTSRIDEIVALPSGSTQGDAELMDIRVKADGTTASSAGASVREQVTDVKNDLSPLSNSIANVNLANPLKFTRNQFMQQDGTVTASENYFTTGKINVQSGDALSITHARFVTAFKAETVSASDGAGDSTVYTVPADVTEVIITGYIDDIDNFCVTLAEYIGSFDLSKIEIIGSQLDAIAPLSIYGYNRFDKTKAMRNKFAASTKNRITDNEGYSISDYIPVVAGEKIHVSAGTRTVIMFDNNRERTSYDNTDRENEEFDIDITSNGYIMFNIYNDKFDSFSVTRTHDEFTKISENVERINESVTYLNLVNSDKITVNHYIQPSGSDGESNNYFTTGLISVKSGDILSITNARFVAAYKNGVISPSDGSGETSVYIVANGVTEINVTGYSDNINNFRIIKGDYALYCDNSEVELKNTQLDTIASIAVEGYNRFDKNRVLSNKFAASERNRITDNQNYSVSDYIPIVDGETIHISAGSRTIMLFDSGKNLLTYDNTDRENTETDINITYNGYIACNVYNDKLNTFSITRAISSNSDLKSKISLIANFGDSIAENRNESKSYAKQISEKLDCTLRDYAHGGDTVSRITGQSMGCILTQVETYISAYPSDKPDVILIDGMANDHTQDRTVGTIVETSDKYYAPEDYTATFDETTYTGALEKCFKLLRNQYLESIIIFVIPHKQGRYDEKWIDLLASAREVCEKWSIAVVDMDIDGELNSRITAMRTLYTDEGGTHQNTLGNQKFYVPQIMSKIRKNF